MPEPDVSLLLTEKTGVVGAAHVSFLLFACALYVSPRLFARSCSRSLPLSGPRAAPRRHLLPFPHLASWRRYVVSLYGANWICGGIAYVLGFVFSKNPFKLDTLDYKVGRYAASCCACYPLPQWFFAWVVRIRTACACVRSPTPCTDIHRVRHACMLDDHAAERSVARLL